MLCEYAQKESTHSDHCIATGFGCCSERLRNKSTEKIWESSWDLNPSPSEYVSDDLNPKHFKYQSDTRWVYTLRKRLVVLTTEWLPWLQSSWRYSGYEKLILVLEANCISNLSPNHTLQLTTHRIPVRESLQSDFTKMMLLTKAGDSLTDVQWSLYLQDLGCCCTDVQWLLSARCWL